MFEYNFSNLSADSRIICPFGGDPDELLQFSRCYNFFGFAFVVLLRLVASFNGAWGITVKKFFFHIRMTAERIAVGQVPNSVSKISNMMLDGRRQS